MASRGAIARLRKEVKSFEAPPYIRAAPLETNLLEWRFVLQGPPDTIYEGGMYQGKIKFPDEFPFKPPSIYMITPSGRFETDRRLCLSMSDFHPETWVPTWSVGTIINGVLSFMVTNDPTTGAIVTSDAEKRRLRDASVAFNAKDQMFCQLFPDLVDGKPFTLPQEAQPEQPDEQQQQQQQQQKEQAQAAAASATATTESTTGGGADDDDGTPEAAAAGEGKNAAKNRKKKEKERAKKAAAAAAAAGGDAAAGGGDQRAADDATSAPSGGGTAAAAAVDEAAEAVAAVEVA